MPQCKLNKLHFSISNLLY